MDPRVSVIVPVYNCRPSLELTVRSVLEQTMPPGAVELIAVDDASTDGSGEELERLAAGHPHVTVLRHATGSGGPGRPRNTGLDAAAGEYVFFLDADDHLGPEALARCVAMADENGTDVVVPKYVGVGRRVNRALFERTVPFTTIHDAVPNLYGSLTALKLYRRRMLDEHGIRFPERVLSGEDQIFAVRAYFEAKGVSVLADYDCYYWVDRSDGTSALQVGGAPARDYFPEIDKLLAYVTERTEPGPVRDRLLRRHFAYEVFSRFDRRYPSFDDTERRDTKEGARALVRRYAGHGALKDLSPYNRVLAHLLRSGHDGLVDELARVHAEQQPPIVVDGRRTYHAYPGFFRAAELAIPDEMFLSGQPLRASGTVTAVRWDAGYLAVDGHARAERVDERAQRVELALRERGGEREYRVPFDPYPLPPAAGRGAAAPAAAAPRLRTAMIDLGTVADGGPLPAGRWDAHAVVSLQGVVAETRLLRPRPDGPRPDGAGEDPAAPGARVAAVAAGPPVVTPYFTPHAGGLALLVGRTGGAAPPVEGATVHPAGPGRRRLAAGIATALPGADRVEVRVLLGRRHGDEVRAVAAAVAADGPERRRITAELPLEDLPEGIWDVSYEISVAGGTVRFRAPAAPEAAAAPDAVRTKKGNLSLVRAAPARGGRLRVLRRLLGRA
ncbi:glycosyltransferase family 2 protein [Actinomadura parmotrematis]|uniref:Glycosyltransferase n=1 Tax=Actinomadura parmotrematis TaxID=2864039 RepID=A0ABS7FYW6_9ACTN|nr:glycosyltransferase family 2 protein [Actinomadura parmotrematis]MBW8484628.1 glycosyltransferase [Actinomadura parmotrematis]